MAAPLRNALAKHLVRDPRARLRHARPPDEAPSEVFRGERLACAIRTLQAADNAYPGERTALHECGRE